MKTHEHDNTTTMTKRIPNIHYAFFTLVIFSQFLFSCQPTHQPPGFEPVHFSEVEIGSDFWSAKIDSNHQNGIPGCFESCDHSLVNFDIAAGISDSVRKGTEATDSDVYKIIQGAAHALDHRPDHELEAYIDRLIDRIAAAQEDDGYLNTYFKIRGLEDRWTLIKTRHELYCAGHLFEAAADYFEVTGKTKLLDMATNLADHIDSLFGPGKLEETSGHQEIELALIRLYEVTGEERYLSLAEYFLEERGNPERLEREKTLGENDAYANVPKRWLKSSYRQDHLPVKDQHSATGHAVRAAYLYRGMSDFARVRQTDRYDEALNKLWNDIAKKKIYITGSIGTAQFHDEGFGSDYNLPNATAYCETCSAIALMYWNHSMLSMTGDAKYADLFELTLYNGGISGGSAVGDRFFYTNPLEGNPRQNRRPWYEPGCCPSNFVRFIPMIDQFIYGTNEETIVINHFIGSKLKTKLFGKSLTIEQATNYPWHDQVDINIEPERSQKFTLKIRIPAWLNNNFIPGDLYQYAELAKESQVQSQDLATPLMVSINGSLLEAPVIDSGYLILTRKWQPNDQISINMNMPIRLVEGRPEIKDVANQQVLTRGPVVYCLEEIDNPEVFQAPHDFKYQVKSTELIREDAITHGIYAIKGNMLNQQTGDEVTFKAIPYFAWRNQGPTAMQVWF